MIEQERRHNNGMGLQKIESFFSDIFGCGGCNFTVAPNKRTCDASAGRSYSNSRPIDSALQQQQQQNEELYKSRNNLANHNHNHNNQGRNLCGGGPPKVKKDHLRWNYTSKQGMIACDEEEDAENSFLNDTATTQPESFLLDDSCLSLPSTISFRERTISRSPLLTVQEPPRLLPERKVAMVPTETVVGVWPPVLPSRANHGDYPEYYHRQQQQQQRKQRHKHRVELPPPSFTLNDEDEIIPPIPVRPPKIRRLKLDDVLVTGRTEQFHGDANGLPRVPQSVCRSRSLDFLFSNKHPKRGKVNHRNHRQLCSDRIRYDEEERARQQLLEMLSDLNETYTTL